MPVIANNQAGPRIVVVERRQNVGSVAQAGRAVRVPAVAPAPVPVRETVRVLEVAARGPQGAPGLPGRDGNGALPAIDFSFGDASPAPVLLIAQRCELLNVSLQIEVAFDGFGSAVSLGTADRPELLLPVMFNDPATVGVYEAAPRVELQAGDQLLLTIVPGEGTTRGRGQLVLSAVPLE